MNNDTSKEPAPIGEEFSAIWEHQGQNYNVQYIPNLTEEGEFLGVTASMEYPGLRIISIYITPGYGDWEFSAPVGPPEKLAQAREIFGADFQYCAVGAIESHYE
jgi:hypothetical protein